jgi:hypothetical protein
MIRRRIEVYKGLGGAGTLGLEIVLSVLLGFFGGRWLDGRLGTEPYLAWLGFGLGVAAGARGLMRVMKVMRAEAAREEREEGNPAPLYETEVDRKARMRETPVVEASSDEDSVASSKKEARGRDA